jgi:hypothetical protein
MDYSNRTYSFINTSDIGSVDFSQVMETSAETVRKSIDESQFILKWYTADWPSFIAPSGSITPVWEGSHSECLNQLTSSFWTSTGSLPF